MTGWWALATVPALLVAGCAAPADRPVAAAGGPVPALELLIIGGADQNPNESGRPTAVAVHLYQLAATARFQGSEPFDLIVRERAVLGAEDLDSEEVTIGPGARRVVEHDLRPGTRTLGVAVLFRDIDRTQWRLSAPVASGGRTRLTLRVRGNTATLEPT